MSIYRASFLQLLKETFYFSSAGVLPSRETYCCWSKMRFGVLSVKKGFLLDTRLLVQSRHC